MKYFRVNMRFESFHYDTRNCGSILSLTKLAFIKSDVLALKFAHFLDLIEVNNEALLVSVTNLNAFSTEDCPMIRTIEMHYAHIVRDAQFIIWDTPVLRGLIEVNWAK